MMTTESMSQQLKIYFSDDPDPEMAGQGLARAPLLDSVLGEADAAYWMMSPSEQMAIIYLLERLRPKVAIEIGTRLGGSLQVLAKFADQVYSLDIDPEVPGRLAGKHNNVEYIVGDSSETLPKLLNSLSERHAELSFILVDGDHSARGVQADIDHILACRPLVPLFVVMHDSFNPDCRHGLKAAKWSDCPYVHAVELDFVAGTVNPAPAYRDQQWGGLALGILLPEKRSNRFEVVGRADQTIRRLKKAFRFKNLATRFKNLAKRVVRGSPS